MKLYVSADGRWFRVPTDLSLPHGDLVLHGVFGGRRQVDPRAVEHLEVDRTAAEALFELRLAGWMRDGAAGLGRVHGRLTELGPPTLARLEQALARVEDTISEDRLQEAASALRAWWSRRRA